MSYQCTRCMLQSFDVQQPRRCARCGGRAFGWLPTGAPRPEPISDDDRARAAPEAGDVAGPVVVADGLDDAPPTPRDGPASAEDRAGFDTLSYELAREERLAVEVGADLGGVKCGEQGCERSATHKFFWPSPDAPPTRFACEEHARKAGEISATLGFDADPQPLEPAGEGS